MSELASSSGQPAAPSGQPPSPTGQAPSPTGQPPSPTGQAASPAERVPELRASDAERQAIADRLNVAVGEGRLTLSEFSDRVGGAYAARTRAELEVLVEDLPAARPGIVVDARPVPVAPTSAPLEIMVGAIKKRGRWRLGASTALGVAVGPMKLDLRNADLAAHEVTLAARTVVGAIKVWVPRGVRVEVEGRTAVGTRTIAESNLPPEMDVPTLRLRLDTGIGTVKVYRT